MEISMPMMPAGSMYDPDVYSAPTTMPGSSRGLVRRQMMSPASAAGARKAVAPAPVLRRPAAAPTAPQAPPARAAAPAGAATAAAASDAPTLAQIDAQRARAGQMGAR